MNIAFLIAAATLPLLAPAQVDMSVIGDPRTVDVSGTGELRIIADQRVDVCASTTGRIAMMKRDAVDRDLRTVISRAKKAGRTVKVIQVSDDRFMGKTFDGAAIFVPRC